MTATLSALFPVLAQMRAADILAARRVAQPAEAAPLPRLRRAAGL